MLYEELIDELNSNKIKGIEFEVVGFAHYKDCRIFHQTDITRQNKKISLIVCVLTGDEFEKVSFLNKFNENYKLFNFGRKGKFTLKQVWDKVHITAIDYAE